jgi:hypothetical protein
MKKFESLPEWMRWVLLLPAVLLCQLVTMTLLTWPAIFFMHFERLDLVWYRFVSDALGAFVLLSIVKYLAPRAKDMSAMLTYIVFAILGAIDLWITARNGQGWKSYAQISGDAGWIIAGAITLYRSRRDKK